MRVEDRVSQALEDCPIIAILRGLAPEDALAIGHALFEAGIRVMEVPLNSPRPLESISRLSDAFAGKAILGAGTVLSVEDVIAVADAGGQICVSPDTNEAVIDEALKRSLVPFPGVFTATEAFRAIRAGARWLKLFPADTAGPGHIKALRAVLPPGVGLLAVGGVNAETAKHWLSVGAVGLGAGSCLFKPGDSTETVRAKAKELVGATR